MNEETPLSSSYLKKLVTACIGIARDVSQNLIMPGFGRLRPEQIRVKSTPRDFVTEIDEQAEAFIEARLRQLVPHALIVGEEAAAKNPDLVNELAHASLAFTIDPIDGTVNYVEGVAAFGVMIAVISHAVPVASIIFNPVSGCGMLAARGAGAWQVDADGRETPLHYAAPPQYAGSLRGKLSWSLYAVNLTEKAPYIASAFERLWDLRCASIEYTMAASGHAHILYYRKVMPWDHCPGYVLLTEAGGYGALHHGAPYRVGQKASVLLYAPNQQVWLEVASALGLNER